MRFDNNNNNGGSQGCVCAPDATDHATDVSAKSTAPLPQPSASGHGELHELHVAKSTAENNQKGNQATMATMLGRSSSLLLVYFVVEYSATYRPDIDVGSFWSPCGWGLKLWGQMHTSERKQSKVSYMASRFSFYSIMEDIKRSILVRMRILDIKNWILTSNNVYFWYQKWNFN